MCRRNRTSNSINFKSQLIPGTSKMDVLYLGRSLDEGVKTVSLWRDVSTVGRQKELVDRFRVVLLKDTLVQVNKWTYDGCENWVWFCFLILLLLVFTKLKEYEDEQHKKRELTPSGYAFRPIKQFGSATCFIVGSPYAQFKGLETTFKTAILLLLVLLINLYCF